MLFGDPKTERVDALVAELRKTPGWPVDDVRDRALIAELLEQFPTLDLADEFGAFRVWLLAKGTGKEVKSRGRYRRVRTWCARAVEYAGRRTGRTGLAARRTSTAPAPPSAFGESSTEFGRL